jgi:hypothetical protein
VLFGRKVVKDGWFRDAHGVGDVLKRGSPESVSGEEARRSRDGGRAHVGIGRP